MKMSMVLSGALMVVVAGLMLGGAHGCTERPEYLARFDNGSEPDTTKLHFSQVVLYGKVMSKVKGGGYMHNDKNGVHAIKFEVFCVYKGATLLQEGGAQIPKEIYLLGGGNKNKQIPGCPKVEVKKDELVIMYVKSTPVADEFEIEYSPGRGDADIILDDLTLHCDLDTIDMDPMCSDWPPYDGSDCLKYKQLPRPATEKPVTNANKDNMGDNVTVEVNPKPEPDNKDTNSNGYDTEKPEPEPEDPKKSTGDGSGAATCLSSLIVLVSGILASLV